MSDFIAGCIGGMFGTFMVYPLDTWRIRKQSNVTIKRNIYSGVISPMIGIGLEKSVVFGSHAFTNSYIQQDFVSGLVSGFFASLVVTPVEKWKIMKQNSPTLTYNQIIPKSLAEGIRPLYNGLSACFLREVPGYAIYFQTYSMLNAHKPLQRFLNVKDDVITTMIYGGLSGMNAWIFIYPFDVIKTNMQYNGGTFMDNTRVLMKSGKLYNGFGLGLTRAFALHSCVFLGYETISKVLYERD